jgi:hypothetical protein
MMQGLLPPAGCGGIVGILDRLAPPMLFRIPALLTISAGQGQTASSHVVVRDRIELSTFRFSEGLYSPRPQEVSRSLASHCLHKGLSRLTRPF